jgi:hypothetical protein
MGVGVLVVEAVVLEPFFFFVVAAVAVAAVVGVVGWGELRDSECDSSLDVSSGTSCSLKFAPCLPVDGSELFWR